MGILHSSYERNRQQQGIEKPLRPDRMSGNAPEASCSGVAPSSLSYEDSNIWSAGVRFNLAF